MKTLPTPWLGWSTALSMSMSIGLNHAGFPNLWSSTRLSWLKREATTPQGVGCFYVSSGIISRQSKEKKMTATLISGSGCDVMIYLDRLPESWRSAHIDQQQWSVGVPLMSLISFIFVATPTSLSHDPDFWNMVILFGRVKQLGISYLIRRANGCCYCFVGDLMVSGPSYRTTEWSITSSSG